MGLEQQTPHIALVEQVSKLLTLVPNRPELSMIRAPVDPFCRLQKLDDFFPVHEVLQSLTFFELGMRVVVQNAEAQAAFQELAQELNLTKVQYLLNEDYSRGLVVLKAEKYTGEKIRVTRISEVVDV